MYIPLGLQRPSLQCSLGAQLVSTVHGLITVISVVFGGGVDVVVYTVIRSLISVVVPALVGSSVGQGVVLVMVVVSGISFEVSSRVVFIFGVVVRLPPSLLVSVVVVITGLGVGVSVILFSPSR